MLVHLIEGGAVCPEKSNNYIKSTLQEDSTVQSCLLHNSVFFLYPHHIFSVHLYVCLCVCVCMCACMCALAYLHVCMLACMCMLIPQTFFFKYLHFKNNIQRALHIPTTTTKITMNIMATKKGPKQRRDWNDSPPQWAE